jgi:hypothetical protein
MASSGSVASAARQLASRCGALEAAHRDYASRYGSVLQALAEADGRFPGVLAGIRAAASGLQRLDFYAIQPIQRLPRYVLLMSQLSKSLEGQSEAGAEAEAEPEALAVAVARESVGRLARRVDDSLELSAGPSQPDARAPASRTAVAADAGSPAGFLDSAVSFFRSLFRGSQGSAAATARSAAAE